MKIVAAADLHLSGNCAEYSLAALEEIVGICAREDAGALLLAGDVFDSWNDVETMRSLFAHALEKIPENCKVFFIPGNHETLSAPANTVLASFNYGKAQLLSGAPFSLVELDGETELLAIPFARDYSGYRGWPFPAKNTRRRIVLAHGVVPGGDIYLGPQEDNSPGALDEDLFIKAGADIVFVGHIHKSWMRRAAGGFPMVSPGSARVWREGEEGAHFAVVFDTNAANAPQSVTIKSAGQFREVPVTVTGAGEPRIDACIGSARVESEPALVERLGGSDYVLLAVSGIVEDENSALAAVEALKTALEKKCRMVKIERRDITVLSGVSGHPLAQRFIGKLAEAREAACNAGEYQIYDMARQIGLKALKDHVNAAAGTRR